MAAGDSRTDAYVMGEGVLGVTGVHIATIQHVHVVRLYRSSVEIEKAAEILRLDAKLNFKDSYVGRGSRLEAFGRTICARVFSD
jgi:hypothetical protein